MPQTVSGYLRSTPIKADDDPDRNAWTGDRQDCYVVADLTTGQVSGYVIRDRDDYYRPFAFVSPFVALRMLRDGVTPCALSSLPRIKMALPPSYDFDWADFALALAKDGWPKDF